MDKHSGTRRRLAAFVGRQVGRARQLRQERAVIFAARTPAGRSLKVFLFGAGMVLPLGILIWLLLFLHGSRIGGAGSRQPPVLTRLSEAG